MMDNNKRAGIHLLELTIGLELEVTDDTRKKVRL